MITIFGFLNFKLPRFGNKFAFLQFFNFSEPKKTLLHRRLVGLLSTVYTEVQRIFRFCYMYTKMSPLHYRDGFVGG